VVIERAREAGAFTIGITNEPDSALSKLADEAFLVRAGREKSVAATKTYTGQLLAFYLLAHALGAAISLDDLRRLPEWAVASLKLEKAVRELALRYRFMDHAVVVGRGLNYSNAFELALKLMETCYVIAERFSSADFLHGPIAIVERAFPVFAFAPSGVTWTPMSTMLDRLQSMNAETLVITDTANKDAAAHSTLSLVVPAKFTHGTPGLPEDLYTPIPYVIPAQLLAACLANEKGLDPDKPRALTKVTRTL
jgi:glucosamine--fructose-6-phosphate aminotransferase (isomerizing)